VALRNARRRAALGAAGQQRDPASAIGLVHLTVSPCRARAAKWRSRCEALFAVDGPAFHQASTIRERKRERVDAVELLDSA